VIVPELLRKPMYKRIYTFLNKGLHQTKSKFRKVIKMKNSNTIKNVVLVLIAIATLFVATGCSFDYSSSLQGRGGNKAHGELSNQMSGTPAGDHSSGNGAGENPDNSITGFMRALRGKEPLKNHYNSQPTSQGFSKRPSSNGSGSRSGRDSY
jgi:hypothetical protein